MRDSARMVIVELIGHEPSPRLVDAVLRVQKFNLDLSDTLDIESTHVEEELMERAFRVGYVLGRDPGRPSELLITTIR